MHPQSLNLFPSDTITSQSSPLAFRTRPKTLSEFHGHKDIFTRFPFLTRKDFPALILWGPPGTGKTTLATILAAHSDRELFCFNAVLGGVADLKKVIEQTKERQQYQQKESIIFIDEIHRFNKAQQDALLPYVEEGAFTLIGATTENPRRAVNRALISRVQCIELKALDEAEIFAILQQTATKFNIVISTQALQVIADYANGDARRALNILELGEQLNSLETAQIKKIILENARDYDRSGDRHYDVISACIKSMRGSDPDAALYWLAVMLDGGEDPVFIARRLVIFASEDVGNADINALQLAVSCLNAVQLIGMPEARIPLAQATAYLAATVKSNAVYVGITQALSHVQDHKTPLVPDHLKNFPPKGAKKYLYPHDFPNHYVAQKYTIEEIPKFYTPTNIGHEKNIKNRLEQLRP